MAKKEVYRTFLESKGSGTDSYIKVTVYDDNDINLKIADCARSVSLGFGFGEYDGRTKATALRKLDKMEKALRIIREHIENV